LPEGVSGLNQLLAQVSQGAVLAAVAAGTLVSSGILRGTAGAAGRGLAGDVTAPRFAAAALELPDTAVVQVLAGRPQ
jgi:hypothetical protein